MLFGQRLWLCTHRHLSFLFVSDVFFFKKSDPWYLRDMSYGTLTCFTACMAKTTNHRERELTASSQRWRGDLLGRGKALWNWQKKQPQPLTETTCSAAKRIWNCKALPVFILLPGLQLVVRNRDLPFDHLRRAGCFIQTGIWLQWPVQLPRCMLC